MTRRALLLFAIRPTDDPFRDAWNAWSSIANARASKWGTETYDAREVALWAEVKRALPKFVKDMDAFYRGQR